MKSHHDRHASPQGPRSLRPAGRVLLALASITVLGLLVSRLVQMQARLDELASEGQVASVGLQTQLQGVQQEIHSIRGDLELAESRADVASQLQARLQHAETRLGSIGLTVKTQASSLSLLEREREDLVPALERELEERDERLLHRWETLSQLVDTTTAAVDESREEISRLDAAMAPRDLHRMWSELVGPVVQLAGDTSVGSGVLLISQADDETGGYTTPLVTAWHVVRDIQGDLTKTDMPVPVSVYAEDGSIRHEEASLLCFDPELDAALLEVWTAEPLENGAYLAPRERLGDVRIFDRVYAVGCPLGNDPIPTYGEIATIHHEVDGELYWMINAPTYIGNSGGGIFDSKTHELLGIFSKIYTHGTLRPTIVPHMGLVTPMSEIYEWLEGEGYATLIPEKSGTRAKVASADR